MGALENKELELPFDPWALTPHRPRTSRPRAEYFITVQYLLLLVAILNLKEIFTIR